MLTFHLQKTPAISQFAPAFYSASMIFLIMLQMYEVIEENEKGTKELMQLFGLRYEIYNYHVS